MFAFVLAAQLGIWDVDELIRNIPHHLMREWQEFANLTGFDGPRQDERHAHGLAALARMLGNKNADVSRYRIRWADGAHQTEGQAIKVASVMFRTLFNLQNEGARRR